MIKCSMYFVFLKLEDYMPQDLYSTKKTIGVEHFLEGKQEKSSWKLPTGKWCFPRFPFPDFLAKIGQSSAQIYQNLIILAKKSEISFFVAHCKY